MGKFSRDKGARFERDIIMRAAEHGFDADHTALMQTIDGDQTYADVTMNVDGSQFRIECKHQESIPRKLWDWLDGNDAVMIKRNNHQPLAVISATMLFDLLKVHNDR